MGIIRISFTFFVLNMGAAWAAGSVQILDAKESPFKYIGRLSVVTRPPENENSPTGRANCSGALIAKNYVLTAAHCVYDRIRKVRFSEIKFYPGKVKYKSEEEIVFEAEDFHFPDAYAKEIYKFQDHDIAVVKLKTLDTKIGWMNLGFVPERSESSDQFFEKIFELHITGYPETKPTGTLWDTYEATTIERIEQHQMRHNLDVYGGDSGAPTYYVDSGQPVILGVAVTKGPVYNTSLVLDDYIRSFVLKIISPES